MKLKQFRSRDLSLWQSAVDEVISKEKGGSQTLAAGAPRVVERPDLTDAEVSETAALCETVERTGAVPQPPPAAPAALGVGETVRFCSATAFKLAQARLRGDDKGARRYEEELTAEFGECDPHWVEVAEVYVRSQLAKKPIPYRRHVAETDFVIDNVLPADATIALLGDWGTGQPGAGLLLKKIAARKPHAVIHLGDVYYSGTRHEMQNYFYRLWQPILGIPAVNWGERLAAPSRPATFTLSGNHDLYAGGEPYYKLIDMLGQPASYFCLRNADWQFIAIDTGLHDANPVKGEITYLEDTEVAWIRHQIRNAGQRKTVLLSHHQLFARNETIEGRRINERLLLQLQDLLPAVSLWLWGHEHDLVIYKRFLGLLARCIGHAAFPVGMDEARDIEPSIGIEAAALKPDQNGGLFQHGYAIMQLNGPSTEVSYFQYDALSGDEELLWTDHLG